MKSINFHKSKTNSFFITVFFFKLFLEKKFWIISRNLPILYITNVLIILNLLQLKNKALIIVIRCSII